MESPAQHPEATAAIRRAAGLRTRELLGLVRRLCGARLEPEDVLQKAFERALERAGQLRDPARADAWLRRIVRNVLLDELRKRPDVALEVDSLEIPEPSDEDVDCPCSLVQAERLKPDYATILRRVVVDGVPVTCVATELGLTPNNAMVRLHRARLALRARLHEHCGTLSIQDCADCGCAERGCCAQTAS